MDDPQITRRRFQLHLSTCVVLMVEGGILVWLNCISMQNPWEIYSNISHQTANWYGFPLSFYSDNPLPYDPYSHKVFPPPLFIDIMFGLAVLCGSAWWCEQRIRKLQGRAPWHRLQGRPLWHIQLHLSPCLMLMFVAGIFLGMNLQRSNLHNGSMSGRYAFQEMGWPLPWASREVFFTSGTKYDPPGSRAVDPETGFWQPIWLGLAIDVGLFVVAGILLAFALEAICRHDTSRKPELPPHA